MLQAFDILLSQPLLLLLVLGAGAAIGIGVERFFGEFEREKRRAYWRGRNGHGAKSGRVVPLRMRGTESGDRVENAAAQLKQVMLAEFTARPLLNKPERRLLGCIDQALAEHSPAWRAMGQVSLGEILRSRDEQAFRAINSKRVDLLIVDADCRPLHAIEFQGTGHHLGAETAARDAVKREALRRAGIGYVEVVSGDTPTDIGELVRRLVTRTITQA